MRRVALLLAVLLSLSLLTPGAVAADTPEECEGEVGNATVDALCDRVAELEETNDELTDENVELEREIVELENELNSSRNFPPSMEEQMKAMGAWDPYENEPATIIIEDTGFFPMVYQYVGPGNGGGEEGGNFNGKNAWKRVAEAEQAKEEIENNGTFTFEIEYGLEGMETEYKATTMAEYEQILDNLERELDTPHGFAAWSDWNNDHRQSAENWHLLGIIGGVAAIGIVGIGAAIVESRTNLVKKRRNKKRREKIDQQVSGGTDSSGRLSRLWEVFK